MRHIIEKYCDNDDSIYINDILEEASVLYAIDISAILPEITHYVGDPTDYLMSLCVPSLEIDVFGLEEDGVLEFYNVDAAIFEKHQQYITRQVYALYGYRGIYNSYPYRLQGTTLYLIMNK